MPKYLITYDLMKPGQVYEGLFPALQKLGARQVLLSTWVMESPLSPSEIRNLLTSCLDPHDRLVVCLLTACATYRTMIEMKDC